MTWVHFVLGGILLFIVVGILWRRRLKRKLNDIDGLGGIQKKGREDVNIIASFGDDEPEDAGRK